MDKEYLNGLVEENLTIRQIAKEAGTSYTNVRYWLGKHDLKTRGFAPHSETRFKCACGETDPLNFYGNYTGLCKICNNQRVIAKGREVRKRVLKELGGKCTECGFDSYQSALDPHHVDPSQKDPAWRSMRGWSWARIEKELTKCILLCSNCHRAVHNGELVITEARLPCTQEARVRHPDSP